MQNLREMPSSLNDACRKLELAADEIDRLRIEREEMRRSRMEECEFVRASCASQIRALRDALKPFAEYYDVLERNGYLNGFDLISRQDGRVLGHAGIQADALKAAHEALTQQADNARS